MNFFSRLISRSTMSGSSTGARIRPKGLSSIVATNHHLQREPTDEPVDAMDVVRPFRESTDSTDTGAPSVQKKIRPSSENMMRKRENEAEELLSEQAVILPRRAVIDQENQQGGIKNTSTTTGIIGSDPPLQRTQVDEVSEDIKPLRRSVDSSKVEGGAPPTPFPTNKKSESVDSSPEIMKRARLKDEFNIGPNTVAGQELSRKQVDNIPANTATEHIAPSAVETSPNSLDVATADIPAKAEPLLKSEPSIPHLPRVEPLQSEFHSPDDFTPLEQASQKAADKPEQKIFVDQIDVIIHEDADVSSKSTQSIAPISPAPSLARRYLRSL